MAVGPSGQFAHHILEIDIGVVSVQLSRLNQIYDGSLIRPTFVDNSERLSGIAILPYDAWWVDDSSGRVV